MTASGKDDNSQDVRKKREEEFLKSVINDFPPPRPREWTSKEIDDELRDNGVKKDYSHVGYFFIEKLIHEEVEISTEIARAQFVINDEVTDANGQLMTGIVDYVAEGIASAAGSHSINNAPVLGVELNRNYLRPAYLGQKVTVIAKPLRKGSRTQVWEMKFEADSVNKSTTESNGDAREKVLFAVARLTVMAQTVEGMQDKAGRSKL